MCEHAFYGKEESRPQIYCKLNNQVCLFSKFCVNQGKYIHKEGVENCYMLTSDRRKIPNGAYYVRFVKRGYAYVELTSDKVIKVKDIHGNIDNYVFLKLEDGEYVASIFPFLEEKKKSTNRKKK